MKHIVILGAGTAGTIMANKLNKALRKFDWQITIVDQHKSHYYQPGFLFIPFGLYSAADVTKPKADFIPDGVEFIVEGTDKIDPEAKEVLLADGRKLPYNLLIIATGAITQPAETEGLMGSEWRKSIFDFYTLEGSLALAEHLKTFEAGKLVVNIAEMPIKCPVAPLEFVFLADWYFTKRGVRDKVEIELVTPLPGAFTKPCATRTLVKLLAHKNINLTTDFSVARVDGEAKTLYDWEDSTVDYDLLVSIPVNMGDPCIGRSGLGDDLNFVPTNPDTLQSKAHEDIFVIGDATDVLTSKAGSVAHFQADILFENIMSAIEGKALEASSDGHATCFIETGFGKGILIDFNYDTEPFPGKFPIPVIGPMTLLAETKLNHLGKLGSRWMYWSLLLKGHDMPIDSKMQMAGKHVE